MIENQNLYMAKLSFLFTLWRYKMSIWEGFILILDIIMNVLIGGSMIASCQCYNVTYIFDIRWYVNMLMNNKNCSYLSP